MTKHLSDTGTDLGVVFLSAEQVRQRYGNRSNMWLWRVREGDPDFPKPLQINGRNYWRIADLLAWEGRRLANAS